MKESEQETAEKIVFDDLQVANNLFGVHSENLRRIARTIGVRINAKGNAITIQGDRLDVDLSKRVLNDLYGLLKKGYPLFPNDIDYAIRMLSDNQSINLEDIFLDTVYISSRKRIITPKSLAQKRYIDAIRKYELVIGMNVNRWTRAVNKDGVEALVPKKQPGRPVRMTPKVVAQLELHLEESPRKFGLNRVRWDGPTLATHLQRQFGAKAKGPAGPVLDASAWVSAEASQSYLSPGKSRGREEVREGPKKNSKRWDLRKLLFSRTKAVLPSILGLAAVGRSLESV